MVNFIVYKKAKSVKKQQGNILVMFTIGLFALIAMAALALDGGHMLLNKNRLQNIADAAALHAAKTLDEGGSHSDARAAVIEIIGLNLGSTTHRDNLEIKDALDLSSVVVDFSKRPDPFDTSNWANEDEARYVKVNIPNINLNNFLAGIMNFSKRVSATALAGPSTAILECATDLVPIMVCGDPSGPADGINADGHEYAFGLRLEELYVLKSGSATADDPEIGPGNFQLLRLGDSQGGADIRNLLAGQAFTNAEQCSSTLALGDMVDTEPGDKVGPSLQGINTRLYGELTQGSADGERDQNNCQGADRVEVYTKQNAPDESLIGEINPDTIKNGYRYDHYAGNTADSLSCTLANGGQTTGNIDPSITGSQRRVLRVVMGDCDGTANGANKVKVMGVGCFFLTQAMGGGNDDVIIGEFAFSCPSGGDLSGIAEDNPGPYKIVLYHVPASKDS